MILPGILSLALALAPQQPAGAWCTVSAGDADVSASAVAAVEADVEPALTRMRQVFPDLPKQPFRIVLHASESALPAELRPLHHEGSPGFALLGHGEIHLLLAEARATTGGLRPVLVHEMTHELLHQACAPWGDRIPRWFHEGLAQVVAGDTYLDASEEVIAWRAAMQQLLPFSELGERFPADPTMLRVAYAQSYSFVAWLERRIGLPAVVAMARSVDKDRSLELALVFATGRSTAAVFEEWRDHVIHGSGAMWRVVLQQFFALSMILALPLLALAMSRRMRADRVARERLVRDEAFGAAPEPMPEPDLLPEDEAAADDAADRRATLVSSDAAEGGERERPRAEETGDPPPADGKTST